MVLVLAASMEQARVVFGYALAFCRRARRRARRSSTPRLARYVCATANRPVHRQTPTQILPFIVDTYLVPVQASAGATQQGYLIGTTAPLDRVLIQREVNSRAGMSAHRALDYNRHSRGPELILSGSDSTNPFRGSKITYSRTTGLNPSAKSMSPRKRTARSDYGALSITEAAVQIGREFPV
jgi:hypothetical protein